MARSRNFVFVLVWLSLLTSAGIHMFSKGFLLNRVSQTDTSSCVKYEDYRCGNSDNVHSAEKLGCSGTDKVASILRDVNGSSGICFPPKAKVILLVIDALRYDFGMYNPANKQPAAYENKLPILTELLRKHPDHSRRLKFVADPPTTTMQRLKGMTTGSLPTFIDIGSNFASPEINEDNLIDQLVRDNRTTVFLGDGTWTELFPNRFTREYAYPSFNIYDLDTVDRAIEKHLPREIARKDWDIIVAHFLGVDHCGHRHGPMHDEMRRKLEEMNEVIRNVTEQMADGTTLIVVGDHGMTKTGDHGGETVDEVEALLFMYSKGTPLLSSGYDEGSDTMQQIDLVPTLASIMGVPIPFSNLGQVNLQLLPDQPVDTFLRYQLALLHQWQNARQIQRYFQRYADTSADTFGVEQLDDMDNKFLILTQRVNTVYTEAAFQSFSSDLRGHLKDILQNCRERWVKFDPQLMAHGLLVTFLACFGIAILIINSTPYQLGLIFNESALSCVIVLIVLATPAGYFFYDDFGLGSPEHGAMLFACIGSICLLSFLTIHHWFSISENMADLKRSANVQTRVSFVYTTCVFFSNSFIVEEQKILSYVTMGFFLAALYTLNNMGGKFCLPRWKLPLVRKSLLMKLIALSLLAVAMVRFSANYFRCREEQGNCTDYLVKAPPPTADGQRKRTASDVDFLPIVALVIYVVCARLYLRASGNLAGTRLHVLLARYGPTVAVVCACGHFTVSKTGAQGIPQLHVDALAWVVYALLLVQLVVLLVNPLLVFVLPKREDVMNVLRNDRNLASEIYKQLKDSYDRMAGGKAGGSPDIPIVCGLATVYSSVFVATGTILTVLLAMLLGAHGTMGLIIVIGVGVAYGIVTSVIQHEEASNLHTYIEPAFRTLLAWIILQQFGFYATAHQPTLSQIDWSAAFVGRTYYFDESNVISALLVLLNTFSATFLLSVLFPLTVFVPFCVYTMCPWLTEQRLQPTTPKRTGGGGGGPSGGAAPPRAELSVRKIGTDGGSVEYRSVTVHKADESGEEPSEPKPSATRSSKHVGFDVTKGELNLYENENLLLGTVFKTGCLLLLLQSTRVFCAMFACALHCRHLMVWKIFAPRFIYEGIGTYVALVGINLGFLLLLRVHGAVSALITAINKDR